jgi:hypothetical protein
VGHPWRHYLSTQQDTVAHGTRQLSGFAANEHQQGDYQCARS